MNWYMEVLKNYAVFDGRARRKEYWMFMLFNIIISATLLFVERLFSGPGILQTIYYFAVFIPTLAVTVRRLHDMGMSGWWVLISFVPFIGGMILLFFMTTDSDPGDNQYGANPKNE